MTGSSRVSPGSTGTKDRPAGRDDHDAREAHADGEGAGFLGFIERVGNKLPDPFWLFVILAGVVAVTSWIGHKIGMSAVDPGTGETIEVESLLTGENISRMVTDAVENFIAFPPLGVVLSVMLGVAVAEQTGFLGALVRAMVAKVGPGMLTFMVALAGVTGSVASDAIYVIIIPLGALAFHAVGRSPIVGAMVAFAASSAGFNASLILNITDLLLAGISTSAANIVDEAYEVSPLANIYFVIPSAIVLALVITAVTELFVDKKAQALVNHDHIKTEELSFDKIEAFRARGAEVGDGAFGENLVVEGIDFRSLPVGTVLECNGVVLEMTQIGKECHSHCEIFKKMGECIMPTEGVFARVIRGGTISEGDRMEVRRV